MLSRHEHDKMRLEGPQLRTEKRFCHTITAEMADKTGRWNYEGDGKKRMN